MMGEERGLFTVGVAGCGQRQVYQVICPMGGDGCTALEGRTPQVPWGYMGFPLCRRMFQINLIHMRRDANDKAGSFKKGTFSVFSASVVTVFTLI